MAQTILRSDYCPPTFLIESIHLDFDLDLQCTTVTNTMQVKPNEAVGSTKGRLTLDGQALKLISVEVNGKALANSEFTLTDQSLTIHAIEAPCQIKIVNQFSPIANTALSGIYASNGNLMSQCEAEGFRRITYFVDRPDVMSRYTVVMRAPKEQFPVLLSNGNPSNQRDLEQGRHEITWTDPFPKPCYLFALVAGKLVANAEEFLLKDGRKAKLSVWVEEHDLPKTKQALESLKRAIRWDENRWDLELDLDDFKIVATNDFNFGAMENKGLNIFNAKYALATAQTATDDDFLNIESVVGHEYFHNWTGDRVTVRDWFQLTLKEGLTVFRDQEFSADMQGEPSARAVQRINDVIALRSQQFPEDASPMAHPIRPDSYQEINNFYTSTVYNKGAEVIRMLQTLLGVEKFKEGFTHYIKTNDNQAVTCEAFLKSMAHVSGRDLTQFERWYSQAGTPRVTVSTTFNADLGQLTMHVRQMTPPSPGQLKKLPFLIPFPIAFMDEQGQEVPVQLLGEKEVPSAGVRMFELTEESHTWTFVGLKHAPVLSLNRGFAAPIILEQQQSLEDKAFLAQHDTDAFNRWDAMNGLLLDAIVKQAHDRVLNTRSEVSPLMLQACGRILHDEQLSPAFKAVALSMPSEKMVAEQMPLIDPKAIHEAWLTVREAIGRRYSTQFVEGAKEMAIDEPYAPTPEQAGKRALKNLLWGYAHAIGAPAATIALKEQYELADNLTDKLAGLTALVHSRAPSKSQVNYDAFLKWYAEPLLLNKWFTVQATAPRFNGEDPVLDRIKALVNNKSFSLKNPNNVYALVLAFFTQNPSEFHALDGSGYAFWKEMVFALNEINPQVASRVARVMENWRRYSPEYSEKMYAALNDVYKAREKLSPSVLEIIEKSLNNLS